VWVPVADEAVAISRLLGAGWAAAPGSRFRMNTPAGIRITISDLSLDDIDPLADAVARAVHPAGRAIV
jgi:DNA-binding transcriptional MocR family regulator